MWYSANELPTMTRLDSGVPAMGEAAADEWQTAVRFQWLRTTFE
jgi:hypothetical protein